MNLEFKFNSKIIRLIQGDITEEKTDAIVNAANPYLRGGGGVDGAIHRAGGPSILKECIERYPKGCQVGEACITSAGYLKAKYIIHTPGPVFREGDLNEAELLTNSYKNSLLMADKYDVKSISFPSISTGSYGYPIEQASIIAISTVLKYLPKTNVERIHFVLFSSKDYNIYEKTLLKLLESLS